MKPASSFMVPAPYDFCSACRVVRWTSPQKWFLYIACHVFSLESNPLTGPKEI